MPRLTLLLLIVPLVVGPRAAFGQAYGTPTGGRPDPYAPQYAPNQAAPRYPLPAGQPSNIGLPPVPSLASPESPPTGATAPSPNQPTANSYYRQDGQAPVGVEPRYPLQSQADAPPTAPSVGNAPAATP